MVYLNVHIVNILGLNFKQWDILDHVKTIQIKRNMMNSIKKVERL